MRILEQLKQHTTLLTLSIASLALYCFFAYNLEREDKTLLLFCYVILFALCYKLIHHNKAEFKTLVILSIAFRLIFLLAIPNLSQDFYRFIWDGRMLLEGFNPYLHQPETFMDMGSFPVLQAQELYQGMGTLSASHFTNYPPLKQLIFALTAYFSPNSILGSVIVMRLFIIAADLSVLFVGKTLLERLKMPNKMIFWYILNPFIIIELTGNLHFEGVMLFFLLWSLYLLYSERHIWAGIAFGLSIAVKLIPLLLLPLFINWFLKQPKGFYKLLGFYSSVGLTVLASFLPFFSLEFINNYAETVGLWFSAFEFNASLYYIARSIGYQLTGYNQIALIGQFIPIVTVIGIGILSFIKKKLSFPQLLKHMLFALSFYFFISTTVHPWYIATLVLLSVFTTYKYPLVWSFMIVLSYVSYSEFIAKENLWILALEYSVVYAVFIYEIGIKKQPIHHIQKG